eukprot:4136948-Lingulodinium_polyedra.AAC.1
MCHCAACDGSRRTRYGHGWPSPGARSAGSRCPMSPPRCPSSSSGPNAATRSRSGFSASPAREAKPMSSRLQPWSAAVAT